MNALITHKQSDIKEFRKGLEPDPKKKKSYNFIVAIGSITKKNRHFCSSNKFIDLFILLVNRFMLSSKPQPVTELLVCSYFDPSAI